MKKTKKVEKQSKKTGRKSPPRKLARGKQKKIGARGAGLKKTKQEKPIGVVTHYFGNIRVAIVKFKMPVRQGTAVWFRGYTTNFLQAIKSMQFNHVAITVAPKGKQVGIKVLKKVRPGDKVFKDK